MTETGRWDDRPPIVVVIDDDASVRAALEDLLGSVGLETASFASPLDFLRSGAPDRPGCLVLDVRMPGTSGLDFQRELAELEVTLPIIFISAHGDIPMAIRAMKAGARDFLPKPFREQDLLDAINGAIREDRLRRRVRAERQALQNRLAQLTAGERRVFDFLLDGLPNKQIAAALGVSEVTVKVRRAAVMRKLGARSLAGLVQIGGRLGLARGEARPADGTDAQLSHD